MSARAPTACAPVPAAVQAQHVLFATGTPVPQSETQELVASFCVVKVTLDDSEQWCAKYDPASDVFRYDLTTPGTSTPGSHAVAIRVSAPDGSAAVNADSITFTMR